MKIIPLGINRFHVINHVVEFKVKCEKNQLFYDDGIIPRLPLDKTTCYIYDMKIHGSIEYLELCILIKKAIKKILNNEIDIGYEN